LTAGRICALGHVGRPGSYRVDPAAQRHEFDMDLRDAIQRIALQFPAYGRPRITAELRRQGWEVNDNLLCIRRRKSVRTSGFRAEAEHFSVDPGMVFDSARNDFHR